MHLSSFWKILDTPLVNCEVFLSLPWSKNFVITDETIQDVDPNANPSVLEIRAPTGTTFKITDTKVCVSIYIV